MLFWPVALPTGATVAQRCATCPSTCREPVPCFAAHRLAFALLPAVASGNHYGTVGGIEYDTVNKVFAVLNSLGSIGERRI